MKSLLECPAIKSISFAPKHSYGLVGQTYGKEEDMTDIVLEVLEEIKAPEATLVPVVDTTIVQTPEDIGEPATVA